MQQRWRRSGFVRATPAVRMRRWQAAGRQLRRSVAEEGYQPVLFAVRERRDSVDLERSIDYFRAQVRVVVPAPEREREREREVSAGWQLTARTPTVSAWHPINITF